jgi:hypothetical protein
MSLYTNLDQIPVVAPFGTDHYIVGKNIFHLQSVNLKDYAQADPDTDNTKQLDQDVRDWLLSDPNIVCTAVLMRKLLERGLLGPPLWVYQSPEQAYCVAEVCHCCGS